jgi:hypothetical protein
MLVGKRRAVGYALRGTQRTTKALVATTSMEILCPNCQRKLTIPEQYAGQQMKCPLCQGTFTAPALAPAAPNLAPAPPPAPPPPAPGPTTPLQSAPPGVVPPPTTPAAPSAPTTPLDYAGKFSLRFNPRYLQYVPVVALLVILVLLFFPWVGYYKGGYAVETQSGFQAAIGSVSTTKDLEDLSPIKGKQQEVSVSVLTIFYLLGFFATLFVVIAAVALDFAGKLLPPNMDKVIRWRWVAAAVVTLGSFFLLLLQDVLPFGLEAKVTDAVEKKVKEASDNPTNFGLKASNEAEKTRSLAVFRGEMLENLQRTTWHRWVVRLHILALVFAVVVMLGDLRRPRPYPRIDLWW